MDWYRWMSQKLPFTDIQRSGATIWPEGGDGLISDTLSRTISSHGFVHISTNTSYSLKALGEAATVLLIETPA